MSAINDGGPAFPRTQSRGTSGTVTSEAQAGMSLRDWFAGKALSGLLADHKDHSDECADGETCISTVARLAYEHADAMIDARKPRP